jgi:hypothetical protein
MNSKIALIIGMGVCLFLPLFAQSPPLPGVVFPVGNAAWIVSIKTGASHAQAAAEKAKAGTPLVSLVRIETIQASDVRSDTFFWSDGKSSQNWSANGIVLSENVQNGSIYILSEKGFLGLANKEIVFDQEFFEWTAGLIPVSSKYEGRPYLLYTRPSKVNALKASDSDLNKEPRPTFMEVAYVDPATRFPAVYVRGDQAYLFTFHPAPGEDLKMPPRFLSKYNRFKLYHQ